jgi:hypothetical protein
MKVIILNNKNYLLVEVPDDAYDFNILSPNYENWDGNYLIAKPDTHLLLDKVYRNNHQIIGLLSDIIKDEDICKGLMIKDNWANPYSHLWTKHNADKEKECWWVSTASDSFLSTIN